MDPHTILIASLKDAEHHAMMWSIENLSDGDRAKIFAKDWFADTPPGDRTAAHLTWMLSAFERHRQTNIANFERLIPQVLDLATGWELELVKNLIILNAAGLAGVSALLAAGKYDSVASIKQAAILFILGCGLAVFNMYSNSKGLYSRLQGLRARREMFEHAATWRQISNSPGQKEDRRADRQHADAIMIGWASAVCTITAIGLVTYALSTRG